MDRSTGANEKIHGDGGEGVVEILMQRGFVKKPFYYQLRRW